MLGCAHLTWRLEVAGDLGPALHNQPGAARLLASDSQVQFRPALAQFLILLWLGGEGGALT